MLSFKPKRGMLVDDKAFEEEMKKGRRKPKKRKDA